MKLACAVFAVVVLAVVTAGTRRMGKEEAIAVVDALADKYDCHNEESNLVDTLAAIVNKNAERQRETDKKCIDDQYEAEYTAALQAEAKATKLMKEAQASFQKASEEWAHDQADISERVRQAKRVRDQEIADADDTKASEVESANEDFKAKTAEAHLAHEQMKGACASNFAQTSAILDQDEAAIKQVEGLVSQLHMCEDAATKAQDTPLAATTSFLESRALRGTFDDQSNDQSDDQAFLETGTAAGCQAVRSKLARVRGNGNSGVATGTVEDMKKSLQLARHKAAEDKAKCDDRAQAMFMDSSQKAQTHHSAGLEAADKKHTSATATANNKYLEATRMLDRLLQEAKAKYERAQKYLQSRTADRDAASAEAKAKGELITSPDGPVMTAEARAASEAAEAHKQHDEKVQAAAATKADSVANAESAHAQSIRDINAQCEEEIQQLEAEKRTVETVQDSLKAIKVVNHDSPTTTAAAATTAAPEAGSTNFVYIKPGESCVAKGFAELTSAQCEARGNEEDSKSLNGEVSGFMGETDSQATPPEAAIDKCLDTNYAVENYSICCANFGYKKEGHGPICEKAAPCVKGGFNHPDCTLSVLAQVTCRLTIDNYLSRVTYNSADLSVTYDATGAAYHLAASDETNPHVDHHWNRAKTFTFTDAGSGPKLEIQGFEHDAVGTFKGCRHSGLALECTASDTTSPWHNYGSERSTWTAKGSDTVNGLSSATLSTPCETTSGFSLTGHTNNHIEIWPSNGLRYAVFEGSPYVDVSKKATTASPREFELWQDEDLSGGTESDNWGTACYYLQIDFQ
eukprot:g4877.t1